MNKNVILILDELIKIFSNEINLHFFFKFEKDLDKPGSRLNSGLFNKK